MKIRLLLASGDRDYVDTLTRVLSDKYDDVFEVCLCTSANHLQEILQSRHFDLALLASEYVEVANLDAVRMPLVLVDERTPDIEAARELGKIQKYQRISVMVGTILEKYAELGNGASRFQAGQARITAVWSPCGGTGKTTVALAYAAEQVAAGKQTTYLDLENFSSTSVYFPNVGKSISTAFGKLDADVSMLLKGIQQQDSGSGITYFCGPDNYDDINILTADDLETLVTACAVGTDELIIDLSSQCDVRTWKIFELSDIVLLVCDASVASQVKLDQFVDQHNIVQQIREKSVLVKNKGAKADSTAFQQSMQLPLVQSGDAISVYKTLSGNLFKW